MCEIETAIEIERQRERQRDKRERRFVTWKRENEYGMCVCARTREKNNDLSFK